VDVDGGGGGAGTLTADDLSQAKGCPASTGAGTDHTNTITADETWTAATGPHRVPTGIMLEATVTIEPCAVVLVGKQATITVGNTPMKNGKIVAHGAVDVAADGSVSARPITFDALDPAAPWGQVNVISVGSLDLSVVAFKNGGDLVVGEPGTLLIQGNAGGTVDGEIVRNAKLDRVLVEGSKSYGINLNAWGTFTQDSTAVWIRNSGSDKYPAPIRIEPGIAGTLPKTLKTTGNHREEILMTTSKTFMRDDTFLSLGIPYRMVGAMYVGSSVDGKNVTLTIEPGVTLGFDTSAGSGMYVGNAPKRLGNLVAKGTADAPIVFTSAKDAKAAGDWMALYFRYYATSGSQISHAKIEYAGADSSTSGYGCGPQDANNDSAIIIAGQGTNEQDGPSSAFVDNTTFTNIRGATVIVSGWYGDGPNLAPSNTFGAGTPGCHVSQPRSTAPGDYCANRRGICW
jgi:hypothetical protein